MNCKTFAVINFYFHSKLLTILMTEKSIFFSVYNCLCTYSSSLYRKQKIHTLNSQTVLENCFTFNDENYFRTINEPLNCVRTFREKPQKEKRFKKRAQNKIFLKTLNTK